ncbi:glycosyltransferase family 4 protein [Gorillibacterium sp. sgz500922]|uniref:glycosyltransferase family 4 protein n=1 Tax=Gorillibacterium sp. sgz500922 TaxID=3446694 RepID=UPI003F67B793
MNILMLVSRLNIGGTEKHMLSLSPYLRAHGIRVAVAAKGGPLADSFKRAGVSLHIMPTGNNLKKLAFLSSILAKGRYQLIHAHDSKSFKLAAALSQQHNIPLIITVHGTYHREDALLAAARVSKRIIAVSPKLSNWLASHHIPMNKIRLIPNGIDLATFRPSLKKNRWRKALHLPSSAQVLVYAGRFSSDKYPLARKVIQATEHIATRNRQFIGVLVGPGRRRTNLKLLAAQVNHRLGRRAVLIRPPMTRIQHAYYAADVVIGTGRVALEAMACAKPVISAGVAGYGGIVQSKKMNHLIECHFGDHGADAPISSKKLSTDINRLLNHPNRAKKFGKDGMRTVRRQFSIPDVGSRLIQLYKEVGGRQQASRPKKNMA